MQDSDLSGPDPNRPVPNRPDPNRPDPNRPDPNRPVPGDKSPCLRSRLAAMRRDVSTRLAQRAGALAVGAATVAIAGFAVGMSTTGTATPQKTTIAAVRQGVIERHGDRADRSRRPPRLPANPPRISHAPVKPAPAATRAAPGRPAAPATPARPKPRPSWVPPLPGAAVTSCYGPRWGGLHLGIDFAAQPGTPVLAVAAGTVEAAGWIYGGYGISVVINHGSGYLTHYAHLSNARVRAGQRLAAGAVIGHEGSTGDSTGPHLHFEVHRGMWKQIEPARWLREHSIRVDGC